MEHNLSMEEKIELENEFNEIVNKYLDGVQIESILTCDWTRVNFSQFSVSQLNGCVEAIKQFSRRFTRIQYPVLKSANNRPYVFYSARNSQ
jgi:protein-arginine kinase activator protein McsA